MAEAPAHGAPRASSVTERPLITRAPTDQLARITSLKAVTWLTMPHDADTSNVVNQEGVVDACL